ncbi:hypothetical protein L5515_007115 [Caenorhabditis briggsae]|uniref:Protein amnionless n=1 Tax=Caenorhabditis briggsae TaxID=6238 RepID=A0AAE9JKS8_CAEBR|nr:hypothetical protein L5515_007115 [Caenorhabditis briggsae]
MLINFRIFLLTTLFLQANANHFTFDASTQMSSAENWLHEEIPCIGDEIRFDSSMPVVAFMDHNVNVESIYLPKNGIIVFTDNGIDLGGDSNWQCAKDHLKQPEQKFYTSEDRHDTSFYNPKNWIPDKRFFLHMNQVPCEYDDVTVSSMSSAQIYLDLPVKVNRFRYYKRYVSFCLRKNKIFYAKEIYLQKKYMATQGKKRLWVTLLVEYGDQWDGGTERWKRKQNEHKQKI